MYLYLGRETVIPAGDIIGIFDLENTSVSRFTKAFLKSAQRAGQVVAVSDGLPKSFIVCGRAGGRAVYLSQISPPTLKKRLGF